MDPRTLPVSIDPRPRLAVGVTRPPSSWGFAAARWCADTVGLVLVDLIVDRLLPVGSAITVVVDDTLFTRSGKKVFGVAWHHDGAAKGPKPIGFGSCWVVAGIVAELPFLTRPVCLPVLARLWQPLVFRKAPG